MHWHWSILISRMRVRVWTDMHALHSVRTTTTTPPPGAGRRVVAEGLSSQLVRPLWGLTGETRSQPGVTVAGGPRGLQGQRDESNDGRHSLGSCCPEDLSVACRPPSGELTHAPTDPRALYRASDEHYFISLGRRPGAPKWVTMLLARCSRFLSTRPRCSAPWPVWPEGQLCFEIEAARRRHWQWHVHGWFCWFDAVRAVFPSLVGRPMASLCFRIQRNAWTPVTELANFHDSRLAVVGCVQNCGFSAVFPQLQLINKVVDIPVFMQRLISMVLVAQKTIEIPHFVDSRLWLRQSSSHSSCSLIKSLCLLRSSTSSLDTDQGDSPVCLRRSCLPCPLL